MVGRGTAPVVAIMVIEQDGDVTVLQRLGVPLDFVRRVAAEAIETGIFETNRHFEAQVHHQQPDYPYSPN